MPGPWYRAVVFDYLQGPPPGASARSAIQPLWPGGAHYKGARFTPKASTTSAIDGLYLASDEITAIAEVTGVLRPAGSPVPLMFEPLALLTVAGALTDILDTTDVAVQSLLGTNQQELTGDWVKAQDKYLKGLGPMPPTQVLGQAAFDVGGIAGLLYESTKSPTSGMGLLVFTGRLAAAGTYLQLYNKPAGKLQQRIP